LSFFINVKNYTGVILLKRSFIKYFFLAALALALFLFAGEVYAAPTITAITPATGVCISPITVSITGTSFVTTGPNNLTLVSSSGAIITTVTSGTAITTTAITGAIIPASTQAGAWYLKVTNTNGTSVTAAGNVFTVTPTVTTINANTANNSQSATITITGAGFFGSGASIVTQIRFEKTSSQLSTITLTSYSVASDTEIDNVIIPCTGYIPGTYYPRIVCNGATSLTNATSQFVLTTSTTAPTIVTITPNTGTNTTPSTLSIIGAGFFGGGSTSIVKFLQAEKVTSTYITIPLQSYTVVNDTLITGAIFPLGTNAGGSQYNIRVYTSGGANVTNTRAVFTRNGTGGQGTYNVGAGQPFTTIQSAINQLYYDFGSTGTITSTQTISIQPGTYYEGIWTTSHDMLSNTSGNAISAVSPYRVILTGDSSGTSVTIDGTNKYIDPTFSSVIRQTGANWTFQNIVIKSLAATAGSYGMLDCFSGNSGKGLVVDTCTFITTNTGVVGLYWPDKGTTVVTNCRFYCNAGAGAQNSGISLYTQTAGCVITIINCTFQDSMINGSHTGNVIIDRNTFSSTVTNNTYMALSTTTTTNLIFRNNFVKDNYLSFNSGSARNPQIYNNLFLNEHVSSGGIIANSGAIGMNVYNNTFIDPDSHGAINADAASTSLTAINNIVYIKTAGATGMKIVGTTNSYTKNNCVYKVSTGTYGTWSTTSCTDLTNWTTANAGDTGSINTNPLFVNASGTTAADFKLQATSPAKFKGADLSTIFTNDYFGTARDVAWDMGFYESHDSPVVSTVTPTSGLSAGLTTLTITGTGFLGSTGSAVGTSVTILTTSLTLTGAVINDTSITGAIVPAGITPGTYDVLVTTNVATNASSAQKFAVMGAVATPVITPAAGTYPNSVTVSITTGTVGATIRYTNDGTTPTGASPIYTTAFTIGANTTITAFAQLGGMSDSATSASAFTIQTNGPVVSGLSPNYGSNLFAQTITIAGSNFFGGTGSSAVTSISLGANNISSYSVIDDSSITGVIIPSGIGIGTYDVTVATAGFGASAASAADKYTVTTAAPVVGSVSPNTGSNLATVTINITGSGFFGGVLTGTVTAVKLGNTVLSGYSTASDSTITGAIIPSGILPGTYDISVTAAGGTSVTTTADIFVVTTPAPAVTSLSAIAGSMAVATTITVNGTGFFGGMTTNTVTAVKLGTLSLTYTAPANDSAITGVVIPPGLALGIYDVTVTAAGGSSVTISADRYTVTTTPPVVNGLSPTQVNNTAPGTISILGTGFFGGLTSSNVSQVRLTSASATIVVSSYSVLSDSQIINAVIPLGYPVGTYDVRVTNTGGENVTSSPKLAKVTTGALGLYSVGKTGQPFTSIQTAIDQLYSDLTATTGATLASPQTITIYPGTYNESLKLFNKGSIVPLFDKRLVITGDTTNPTSVTIDGTGTGYNGGNSLIELTAQYFTLSSVVLTASGAMTYGPMNSYSGKIGLIIDNVTSYWDSTGIATQLYYPQGNSVIKNSRFIGTGSTPNMGVVFYNPPNGGSIVTNCQFINSKFSSTTSSYPLTIVGNTFSGYTAASVTAINLGINTPALVYNNYITGAYIATSNMTNVAIYNNLIRNQNYSYAMFIQVSPGANIYNNTITGIGGGQMGVYLYLGSTNCTIKNNIIQSSSNGVRGLKVDALSLSGTNWDYNDIYLSGTGSFPWNWNGTDYSTYSTYHTINPTDTHSITLDPKFVNVSGTTEAEFKLQAASPAKFAALDLSSTGITNDYFGTARDVAWDMGFYESHDSPVVSTVTPTSGLSAGLTTLTITGTGFLGSTGSASGTSVAINGTTLTLSGAVINDTSIAGAIVPAGITPGTYDVLVTTNVTTNASSAQKFAVMGAVATPVITPASGTYSNSVTVTISTGTVGATIRYTNDGTTPTGASSIYTAPLTIGTSATITAFAQLGGMSDSAVTASSAFTITTNGPVVSGLSANSGSNLSAETITISGSNFFGGTGSSAVTSISLGANNISSYSVINDSSITEVIIPAGIGVGTYDVTVATGLGTSAPSSADKYTVTTAAPVVGSVSPNTGSNLATVTININGSGFFGGVLTGTVTAVKLGNTVLSGYSTASDSTITGAIILPGILPGTYDISVTAAGGTSVTSTADYFAVTTPAPSVTSLSAVTASRAVATTITINGTGFFGGMTTNTVTAVKLGTLSLAFTAPANDSAITGVIIPAGLAMGTYDVTVAALGGTSSTSSADQFAVKGGLFTTSKAGNWSDNTVWTPAFVPTNGDMVSIRHNVTVDSNVTIGHSPQASDVMPAVSVNTSGAIISIPTGVTLRVRGDLFLNAPYNATNSISMAAGSALVFDPSQAATPSTASYNLIFGSLAKLYAYGTSGSHATIMTDTTGGGSPAMMSNYLPSGCDQGIMTAQYTDFYDMGTSANNAFGGVWVGNSSSSSNNVSIVNCNFTRSSFKIDANSTTMGDVYFAYNTFTTSMTTSYTGYNECFFASFNGTKASGVRKIYNNGFDKFVNFQYTKDADITDNYFGQSYYMYYFQYASMNNNFLYQDDGHNSTPISKDVSNFYVASNATGNPHFLGCGTNGNALIDGFVMEYLGTSPDGDDFMAGSPSSPHAITIKHSIKLPNAAGLSSGTFFSALGNSNLTIVAEHNTMHLGGNTDSSGARYGETYNGFTGMIPSYKSNLVWDTTARGYKLCSLNQSVVTDVVTSANADYNGGFNFTAGSNGNGYTNMLFSSGTPGAHDVTGDPFFVDPSRNLAKWSVYNGSVSGTTAGQLSDAYAYLKANPLLIGSSLLPYVKAGFVPRNPIYRNAGHDSADLGAQTVSIVPAPAVSSINITSGSNSAPVTINITGSGFFGTLGSSTVSAVTLGATAITTYTVAGDGSITGAVIPSGMAPGTYDVTVAALGGTSVTSSADQYAVTAVAPAVTSLSASTGSNINPVTLTVNGSGFFGGAGSSTVSGVKLGTLALTYSPASSDSVLPGVVIPSGLALGTYDITVAALGGTSVTSTADQYTVTTPAPVVSNVSPNSGSGSAPVTVSVTGSGFFGGLGSSTVSAVMLGTQSISYAVANDTSLGAVIPAGLNGGTYDITVTALGGTSSITANDKYEVQSVISITLTDTSSSAYTSWVMGTRNLNTVTTMSSNQGIHLVNSSNIVTKLNATANGAANWVVDVAPGIDKYKLELKSFTAQQATPDLSTGATVVTNADIFETNIPAGTDRWIYGKFSMPTASSTAATQHINVTITATVP